MLKQQLTLTRNARLLALAALALLCGALARADVYKWVDKDGVTHYSDRPVPGSEKVIIPPVQTYEAPTTPKTPVRPAALPGIKPAEITCEIVAPKNEETLTNVPSVVVTFRGPDEQSPVLTVNKKRYTPEPGFKSLKLQPVPRGAYEVELIYLDSLRNVVCTAKPITFYVRQPSVINNPARRR